MTQAGNFQFSDEEIDTLCYQLLSGGTLGGANAIDQLMSRGLSVRELYLDLITPVSNRFDQLWSDDRVTFLEVNVAMARIEAVLRRIVPSLKDAGAQNSRRAVFASVPGEVHTVGLRIAANLQRSKGWDIDVIAHADSLELQSQIEDSTATILGLTISTRRSMHKLYSLVRTLRISRPDMRILVSGSLMATDTQPVELLGVDAIAASFEEAEVKLDEFAERPSKD